jgi:hypothetical protein
MNQTLINQIQSEIKTTLISQYIGNIEYAIDHVAGMFIADSETDRFNMFVGFQALCTRIEALYKTPEILPAYAELTSQNTIDKVLSEISLEDLKDLPEASSIYDTVAEILPKYKTEIHNLILSCVDDEFTDDKRACLLLTLIILDDFTSSQ